MRVRRSTRHCDFGVLVGRGRRSAGKDSRGVNCAFGTSRQYLISGRPHEPWASALQYGRSIVVEDGLANLCLCHASWDLGRTCPILGWMRQARGPRTFPTPSRVGKVEALTALASGTSRRCLILRTLPAKADGSYKANGLHRLHLATGSLSILAPVVQKHFTTPPQVFVC